MLLLFQQQCVCVCVCVQLVNCARLLATPWTVTHHVPLSMVFLKARILEWVAISSSRGSSQPKDQTRISCIGRRILYH